jgi:hypothetical protein
MPFFILSEIISTIKDGYKHKSSIHNEIKEEKNENEKEEKINNLRKELKYKIVTDVINAVFANKNSLLSERTINRVKKWFIVLLSIASGITTCIGLIIVVSDVSPLIAIILGFVIQAGESIFTASKGRISKVLLVICFILSVSSDYVCYINTVFPYDEYLQTRYESFERPYKVALGEAIESTKKYENAESKIEIEIKNTYNLIGALERTFADKNPSSFEEKVDDEVNKIRSLPSYINGMETKTITGTGERKEKDGTIIKIREESSSKKPTSERISLDEKISIWENNIKTEREGLRKTVTEFSNRLKEICGNKNSIVTYTEYATNLFNKIKTPENNEEDFNSFAESLYELQKELNNFLDKNVTISIDSENKETKKKISEISNIQKLTTTDLSEFVKNNEIYNGLIKLQEEFPSFDEIRSNAESNSALTEPIYWVLDNAAKILESDFAMKSSAMQKEAKATTTKYFDDFMDIVSRNGFINELEKNDEFEKPWKELEAEKEKGKFEFKDALSIAFGKLTPAEMKDNVPEVVSRTIYALLADCFILMIGFSMVRKNMIMYRVRNRKDLTGCEPELFENVIYNLFAQKIPEDYKAYEPITLIKHLEDYMDCFETEMNMQDENLDVNFVLVCKDEDKLNRLKESRFKELTQTLISLGYLKSISEEGYNVFTEYKRNKAAINTTDETVTNTTDEKDKSYILPELKGESENSYYLMNQGGQFYLREIMNELYKDIDPDSKM